MLKHMGKWRKASEYMESVARMCNNIMAIQFVYGRNCEVKTVYKCC